MSPEYGWHLLDRNDDQGPAVVECMQCNREKHNAMMGQEGKGRRNFTRYAYKDPWEFKEHAKGTKTNKHYYACPYHSHDKQWQRYQERWTYRMDCRQAHVYGDDIPGNGRGRPAPGLAEPMEVVLTPRAQVEEPSRIGVLEEKVGNMDRTIKEKLVNMDLAIATMALKLNSIDDMNKTIESHKDKIAKFDDMNNTIESHRDKIAKFDDMNDTIESHKAQIANMATQLANMMEQLVEHTNHLQRMEDAQLELQKQQRCPSSSDMSLSSMNVVEPGQIHVQDNHISTTSPKTEV